MKLKHFDRFGLGFCYNQMASASNQLTDLPVYFTLCGPIMTESTLSTDDIKNHCCTYVSSQNYLKVNDALMHMERLQLQQVCSMSYKFIQSEAYVMPAAGPCMSLYVSQLPHFY